MTGDETRHWRLSVTFTTAPPTEHSSQQHVGARSHTPWQTVNSLQFCFVFPQDLVSEHNLHVAQFLKPDTQTPSLHNTTAEHYNQLILGLRTFTIL